MKINKLYMLAGALFFGAVALTSCGDDEETYDIDGIDYQRVYIPGAPNDVSATIVKTPVGYIKILSTPIVASATKATNADTHVQFAIDNSKVDEYNKANGTHYLAAPEGAISFDKSSLTIKADTESSADTLWVKFSDTAEQLLTDKAGYVIPVVISSCDGEGYRPSTNMSTKYIVVALEESAVRIGGTQSEMLGTAITDYSSWTSTPNGFQSLFSGSSWSRRYAISENPGVFTLDMQTSQNLTGIAVYAMYANYIRWYGDEYKPQSLAVEISSDGSTFTSLGKLSGDDLVVDNSGYAWFDLYGPMPCRYIRVTIEGAPGLSDYSYYWSLSGFRAYVE